MRVLITGGTGLIGSFVARRLLSEGDGPVVLYDPAGTANVVQRLFSPEEVERLRVVRGDVLDLPSLIDALRENRVECLVHLAYYLGTAREFNPLVSIRTNCEGTLNVFEAARLCGVPRVVWASSVAVFGPRSIGPDGTVANDAPYDPRTIYGAAKVLNERTALHYARAYGLETVGLRFTVVYGPFRLRGYGIFLSNLIERLAAGLPAQVPMTDEAVNWVYVEDVASAIVRAIRAPRPRTPAFNIGGDVRTIRQVVEMAARFFPDAQVTPEPGPFSFRLPPRYDLRPAQEELGWRPTVTVEEGVRRCVEFYRSQG